MDIKEIIDLVNSLEAEHADAGQGAREALEAILSARKASKMDGIEIEAPEEIEIDPDLEKPDTEGDPDVYDDTKYDDPDKLLDREESEDADDDADEEAEDEADEDEDNEGAGGDSDDDDEEGEGDTDEDDGDDDGDEGDKDEDDDSGRDSKSSKDSDKKDKESEDDADDDSDSEGEGGSDSDDDSDSEDSDSEDSDADDSDSDVDADSSDPSGKDSKKDDSDSKEDKKSDPSKDSSSRLDSEDELRDKKDKSDSDKDTKTKGSEEEEDEYEVDPLDDEEEEIDDSEFGDEIDDIFAKDDDKIKERRRQIGEASSIKNQAKEILKKKADEISDEQKEKLEDIIKQMDEILENSEPMDSEEFDDKISDALDVIDKIVDIIYMSEEENEKRISEIEQDFMNPLEAEELEQEDEINRSEDPTAKKLKAREAEKERIKKMADHEASAATGSLEKFKQDLKKAIGEQVGKWLEIDEPTYSLPDRHHEDDGIMAPATRIDEVADEDKPSVDVYIDQSGSWSDRDVKIALNAVAELLKFEEQELLNLNIFYFSQYLTTDRAYARAHGGYECWDLIIDQINAKPKTKNVVMITDRDIGINWGVEGCHGCKFGAGTVVDGCVWFLWKDGSREPVAPAKLRGKQGTFQYQFKSR